MGMYTKYSVSLNIVSIMGNEERELALKEKLEELKLEFKKSRTGRSYVIDSLCVIGGHNGCLNIYGHGEIKNYDGDIEDMCRFLMVNFPSSEGILYIQYEEDENPTIHLFSHCRHARLDPNFRFVGYGNNC